MFLVKKRGAKAIYGPDWPHSKAATLRQLAALTDREYMRLVGCDHCDDAGNCLGHDEAPA